MFRGFKHNCSCAMYIMKLNVQGRMEYPAFLIGWFLSNFMQFFAGVLSIKFITNTFYTINGWEFNEILFMYGLSVISHGLTVIFFIQTRFLQYFITSGELDRMMVRPLGVFMQYIFAWTNLIGFTDLIPGIIILAYGMVKIGFVLSVGNILKILIILLGATLLRGGMYVFCATFSFWTKRGDLTELLGEIFDKTVKYPLSIYGTVFQWIFTFILPIGFISFYPAGEFLGKDTGYNFPLSPTLICLGLGIVIFVFGVAFFYVGLKSYESAGN